MFVKGNNISKEDIRNILLIQLGDIGDVVLSFPSVRALHENFPQANIIVAVREKARELMEDCRWASDVISINEEKRTWIEELRYQKKFFSDLRRFHFDLAVDMRTGERGAFLALLSRARQKIGFFANDGKIWRNRVFTHLVIPESNPGGHMTQYYLGLLEAYNIKTDNLRPEHDIPDDRYQKAKVLLKNEGVPSDRPIIAVQPFSLWKYKEWGMDKYIQLIHWLISEYNVSVIITGSLDERERADEIIKKCPQNTYNLAGRTFIGTLAAVFKTCRLFIGVDSAGVHIAAAVGLPTVCIFGPSSYIAWAPRGAEHRVVHKDFPCVPCKNKGCEDSGFSRCLEELTFEEVQDVVKTQMRRSVSLNKSGEVAT
ncbi:MAG: glycosyltransferase family 9 protein [Syntrophobacterales bacterium]|nr:glycosyltransferase family 9 protein [Syntrophobacterales bacterium]